MLKKEAGAQKLPVKRPIQKKWKDEKANPLNTLVSGLFFIAGVYLFFSILQSMHIIETSGLENFNMIFISILMQAFPFVLIGVLVSSAMHIFIPDEWIVKVFPTKYGVGFLTAMFAGLLFPVCECAIVPVMTRLVKKGVAMPIAITFMLSAPIINPIVIISTLYAFPGQPEIALMRVCFGLLIALLVGLAMSIYGDRIPMLLDAPDNRACNCGCTGTSQHHAHNCTCHSHSEDAQIKISMTEKCRELFLHAGDEFFNVGKYLVLGACMTSLIQTLIPRDILVSLGAQRGLSLLVMMAVAFLLSACSTSDAFIARSFMSRFSAGAVMGFMVFGPMMDVKNLLMLLESFEKSFVIRLSLLIIALNFIVLTFLTYLFL